MRYLPHTKEDISAMLKVVGVDGLDGLFSTVPEDCLKRGPLNLPDPLTEWELNQHMSSLAASMATIARTIISSYTVKPLVFLVNIAGIN